MYGSLPCSGAPLGGGRRVSRIGVDQMKTLKARLAIMGLAMTTATFVVADEPSKKLGAKLLHCQLIASRDSDPIDGAFPGDLELRNDSKEPIVIKYKYDPTDHLNLEVHDSNGKLLPNEIPNYGGMYETLTPPAKPLTLTIKPGETHRRSLVLLGQICRTSTSPAPGKYTVEAVYKWGGKEYRSNKVTLQVRPQ